VGWVSNVVYAEHPTGKNLEIQVLRCFAVVIVICGHSHNFMPWHDGLANTSIGFWTGVDVFLCISGFVITKAFSDAIRRAAQAVAGHGWMKSPVFLCATRFCYCRHRYSGLSPLRQFRYLPRGSI
jgi:hypothetical protein